MKKKTEDRKRLFSMIIKRKEKRRRGIGIIPTPNLLKDECV